MAFWERFAFWIVVSGNRELGNCGKVATLNLDTGILAAGQRKAACLPGHKGGVKFGLRVAGIVDIRNIDRNILGVRQGHRAGQLVEGNIIGRIRRLAVADVYGNLLNAGDVQVNIVLLRNGHGQLAHIVNGQGD